MSIQNWTDTATYPSSNRARNSRELRFACARCWQDITCRVLVALICSEAGTILRLCYIHNLGSNCLHWLANYASDNQVAWRWLTPIALPFKLLFKLFVLASDFPIALCHVKFLSLTSWSDFNFLICIIVLGEIIYITCNLFVTRWNQRWVNLIIEDVMLLLLVNPCFFAERWCFILLIDIHALILLANVIVVVVVKRRRSIWLESTSIIIIPVITCVGWSARGRKHLMVLMIVLRGSPLWWGRLSVFKCQYRLLLNLIFIKFSLKF